MAKPSAWSRQRKTLAELGPWFHNIYLPDGTQTAPDHPLGDFPRFKWCQLAPHLPEDLSGWTALDIGCNAGFYSIELARRGARVTGIDVDERYLAQADWAAGQCGVRDRVDYRQMQVYDLARSDERYDLVLFMGVFYHLRYPMLGLDIVCQKVKRLLVFQSLTMPGKDERLPASDNLGIDQREPLMDDRWPKLAFIEERLFDDPTNWWAPNEQAMQAMLRAAGMRVLGKPMDETFLAEPDPEHPSAMTTWNKPEMLSALGLPWREEWTRQRMDAA